MTLWQDPPPQSRRQARENERAAEAQAENSGRSRRAATMVPTAAGEIPEVSTPFGAAGSENGGPAPVAASASAVRPAVPRYDGASFDSLVSAPPTAASVFRPAPARGSAEPLTSPLAVVNAAPVAAAPVAVTPVAPAPSAVRQATPEHTLTRRELRAMLQAQEANQLAAPQPAPAASGRAESAGTAESAGVPIAALPLPSAPPVQSPPTSREPAQPTPAPAASAPWESAQAAPVQAPPSVMASAPTPASTPAPASASAIAPRPYAPTVESWPMNPATDAAPAPAPAPNYSRSSVTTGSVTTSNALIIPTVPSLDALAPLTGTGEILITGSIDLPRSLGSTGHGSDRMDTSAIDRLFDQAEAVDQTPTSVAPIRASRAVSSHTSTRDVITPPKARGNKLPTILAITAAVLALGVVGLLVAGYVFKVF